jgi:hypothetical protein
MLVALLHYFPYYLCVPATIPVHIALRARLKDAGHHALSLNERLESVIAVKSRTASGGFHGKIDFSQPPWQAQVAMAIMDLHAQVREAEGCLRVSLRLPYRERGGSSGNTRKAMEAVLRLSEGADDGSVKANTRWIDGWNRKASIALGKTEIPFCKNRTLRMLPLEGLIKCINPVCKDEKEKKPEARLEYFEHELVLRWQDDIIGLPVAA